MAKRVAKHLHRYKRITLGNDYKVYKCIKPGCTHYIAVYMSEGALCECNRCGEPMVITKAAMLLARPHCQNCTKKTKKQEQIQSIEAFLENKI